MNTHRRKFLARALAAGAAASFGTLLTSMAWGCSAPVSMGSPSSGEPIIWHLDNLAALGGHPITLIGQPKVIATPQGKAIEFNGIDDALFLDVNPLAGWSVFTVEVIFIPYAEGAVEQRFFHMQETGSESRVMFETRLVAPDHWFLDTFIQSGEQKVVNYASDNLHAVGTWCHAAIVVDGKSFKHFVNGQLEINQELNYVAQQSGRTSLGVRINQVNWFKGAIRTIRFTPRPLTPDEFLNPEN